MIYHETVTVENRAELPFELYPEGAPRTIESFVKLVREGYYNGKAFHHVIKSFVSQDGHPYGTGARDLGCVIPREAANNPHEHEDESLPTAHYGKNTGCCQFLICYCPQPHLGGAHTVFGKVADNLGVVRNMCNGGVMKKVVIEEV